MKRLVLLSLLAMVFAVLLPDALIAQDSKVVYIVHDPGRTDPATGESPEMPIANAIEETLGYQIVMFPVVTLETATPEQLDELRAADLIIIGRAIGSWNWNEAGRAIWNSLETPVLSTNPFAIRPAQLNWYFGSEQYGGVEGEDVIGTVNFPDDPVFEGIELDEENQFAFWNGGYTCVKVDAVFPGDGDILIQRVVDDGATIEVLFGRFEAGEPFYEGGDTTAGARTYIGLGIDGEDNYRYWNYTDDGKTVFLNEVERLANLSGGGNVSVDELTTNNQMIRLFPNPASQNFTISSDARMQEIRIADLTGRTIQTFAADGFELNVETSNMHNGIYFISVYTENGVSIKKLQVQR